MSAGWTSLAGLADPVGRAQRHRLIGEAAGPGAPPHLPVVWEIEAAAWFVGAVVGADLIEGRALPDAEPERAWVRIGSSGLTEEMFLAPDGPRAPSCPAAARAAIGRLLAPIIESRGDRSTRVLWWHAGDRVADAMIWCGDEHRARSEALRLAEELLAPGAPFSVPLGTVRPEGRVRRTCCLSRRTASGETCEGCPHRR